MAKVMLVDDEMTMVQLVTELLRCEGHEVFPFTNGNAAIEALDSIQPELVISDLYLDRTRALGLEILRKGRAMNPPAIVVMITGFGSIETAVEAMKQGAYDYLEKPFKLDELKLCLQRALNYNEAISENVYLKKQLRKKYQFNQIIGTSLCMQKVYKMVERVADTESTILVLGESGTGKELVARALHFNSRRQHAPFVPVNCAALPEHLLESELFGHRKGAFTGAIADKKGLFHEADGGTIFLDEIGSMPATLQSRLLRFLQEKEVRRVGDNTPTYVNVRVVAATNEALEEKIKTGGFREDLYYRLNVIPITLPSLKERAEDIPLLVSHFLKDKVHSRTGKPYQVTRPAMEAMLAHTWPGNVRELENAIERACALSEEHIIQVGDLPPAIQAHVAAHSSDTVIEVRQHSAPTSLVVLSDSLYPLAATPTHASTLGSAAGTLSDGKAAASLKDFLRDQELTYLTRVLAQTGGDKDKAASLAGISLATLYRKLAEAEDAA